jgi:SCY1-like protein 1
MALAATADCFSDDDIASKILPAICPLLLDKEKLVRDQANKALDIYLRQIRKAAALMADTALPPDAPSRSVSTTPRMSTPQASEAASWAGWAISSFTNKLSTAAGDIEPSSPSAPSSALEKPATLPIRATASASALHRQTITSPPPPLSTRTSTSSASAAADYFAESPAADVGEDDFEAWGDMDGDEATFADAVAEQPKSMKQATSAANPFGDAEEPDFAGWLAAQAGKKTGGKPLPKGLGKASVARPAQVGRATTGGAGTRKVSAAVVKPVVKKVIDTKPKDVEDDDGWGDGW